MIDQDQTISRRLYFSKFGDYLKKCRNLSELTQEEVAQKAQGISQGLLALYETGRIADPQPRVLWQLAHIYNVDYLAVMLELIKEKYDVDNVFSQSEIFEEKLRLWKTALQPQTPIADVAGLEIAQLRAKRAMFEYLEVLDLDGILDWQMNFKGLSELWLILPGNYLDDDDFKVRKVTVSHLKDKVRLCYFINDDEEEAIKKIERLRGKLAYEDEEVDRNKVKTLVKVKKLSTDQLGLIKAGFVIANPGEPDTRVGFRIIEFKSHRFAIRLEDSELQAILHRLHKSLRLSGSSRGKPKSEKTFLKEKTIKHK